jgi:hypothetical protein
MCVCVCVYVCVCVCMCVSRVWVCCYCCQLFCCLLCAVRCASCCSFSLPSSFSLPNSVQPKPHTQQAMDFKTADNLKAWLVEKQVSEKHATKAAPLLFEAEFDSPETLEGIPAQDLRPPLSVPLSLAISNALKPSQGVCVCVCMCVCVCVCVFCVCVCVCVCVGVLK